jgi:hypothetical protein
MHFTSRANGWSGVFGSANNRPVEVAAAKDIALRLKAVTQVVSTGQPEGTTAGNVRADAQEARRSREEQISQAIDRLSIDMTPALKPLFWAFRIIGVGHDDALQDSLDAINRAAEQMKRGSNDAARGILKDALSKLALGNLAGGHKPPAVNL